VLDASIGKKYTMLDVKVRGGTARLCKHLLEHAYILWMHPLPDQLNVERDSHVVLEDGKSLLGPEDFAAREIPAKTAGLAKLLRFGEVLRLTLSEQFLGALAMRVMSLLVSRVANGFPAPSCCSVQRLATITFVPSRLVCFNSPSPWPSRRKIRWTCSRGRGNSVFRSSSATLPIAFSLSSHKASLLPDSRT
jgi:hypothetical protein